MMVAAAPDCRSLTTMSSSNSHGGLHQLCSLRQSSSGRRKQSTASAFPSRHLALYRGTCLFSKDANRSTECEPHRPLKCLNTRGDNCLSELSVVRSQLQG